MIALPGGVRILIATRPIDFRKGMDGLAAVVKEHLRADPFSGTIFVFRAKRADRVKLIVWDGTGLCLFAKRLEQGMSCPRIFWTPICPTGGIHDEVEHEPNRNQRCE